MRKMRGSNVNELELLTRNGILSDSSQKRGIQRSIGLAAKRSACIPSVYINAYLFRAFSGGGVVVLKTPHFSIFFGDFGQLLLPCILCILCIH